MSLPDPLIDNNEFEQIIENETAVGLFHGDTGELHLETRRVFIQLLSGPSLDGKRHTKLWPVLLRDEEIIRKRLSDLFLELVIDKDTQIAFTRQADTGDIDAPRLLRRSQLTFIDSVLLLHLRQLLAQAESHGDRAVVSKNEITEHLNLYERTGNTDKAGFAKRIHASIEKFKERSILQKIPASEDRFEVSPALKLLFSAAEILELSNLYKNMADNES
ncbi:MAG: DUF4194 domain-containing protein [Treponema sp.]|nr:DUF4194 domain-containing protein [Treponema sp.]